MQITCVNCKQNWEVPGGQLLAARLKFGLGFVDHTFRCPHCNTKNVVPATEYEASDHARPLVPITAPEANSDTLTRHPAPADNGGGPAPTNPVPSPKPARQVRAVVLEGGLPLLREPNWTSETMATLSRGDEVTVLDLWTDGEQTWVQIGPERWALIEQDGRPLFELLANPSDTLQ